MARGLTNKGNKMKCFECGNRAEEDHHVVPVSKGGTKVVNVCLECHGKIHGINRLALGKLTSEALKAKWQRGEYCGGRLAYGKQNVDGKVELNETEKQVLVEAKRLREAGLSYRAIAAEMELAGLTNRKGSQFNHNQIRRFIAA